LHINLGYAINQIGPQNNNIVTQVAEPCKISPLTLINTFGIIKNSLAPLPGNNKLNRPQNES